MSPLPSAALDALGPGEGRISTPELLDRLRPEFPDLLPEALGRALTAAAMPSRSPPIFLGPPFGGLVRRGARMVSLIFRFPRHGLPGGPGGGAA